MPSCRPGRTVRPSRLFSLIAALLALVAVLLAPAQAVAAEVAAGATELPEACEGHLDLIQEGAFPDAPLPRLRSVSFSQTSEEELAAALNTALANIETGDVPVRSYNVTVDDFKRILENVVNSNPDLFYVSSGYTYWRTQSGYVTGTLSVVAVSSKKTEYQLGLTDLLMWVPQDASQAEQVKAVHDWLCKNVLYGGSTDERYNAYGAIVNRRAVCQGYSAAMISALRVLGIDACYAMHEEANHAWNIVSVDGLWYHVDATWDDPIAASPSSSPSGDYEDYGFEGTPLTTYFLKSGTYMVALDDTTHASWEAVGSAYGALAGIDTENNTAYDAWEDFPVYAGPWDAVSPSSFSLADEVVSLGQYTAADLQIIDVTPAEATTLSATWTSSNPTVVAVDRLGHVTTGGSAGVAVVTCQMGEVSRSCVVRVPLVMHRLYNKWTGEHFYTSDDSEFETLVGVGWADEGVGWYAPTEGDPVYRLYNSYAPGGDHHYTMDAAERDHLIAVGWSYEGIGWYSDPFEQTPLYRQYNPYATTGTHNYTADAAENATLVDVGWHAEGIAWYGA